MLEWYSPWCQWCKYIFNDLESLIDHYGNEENDSYRSDLKIARVNGADFHTLTHSFRITAYPTLCIFKPKETKISNYFQANKTKTEFIKWIDRNLPHKDPTPKKAEPKTADDFDKVEGVNPAANIVSEDTQTGSVPQAPRVKLVEEQKDEEEEMGECVPQDAGEFFNLIKMEIQAVELTIQETTEQVQEELDEILAVMKEEAIGDVRQYDRLMEKLEIIEFSVKNRNRVEDTQTRFNFSHLAIFVIFGCILGCAVSIVLTKIQKPEKRSY